MTGGLAPHLEDRYGIVGGFVDKRERATAILIRAGVAFTES